MIPDRLFDLALLYKKTKLWKKLWDSQLFAVRFSDGVIGYCCVMGRMGELNAIAVYPGQEGLDSLRALHDHIPAEDTLANMERMHCQDCLMLSFSNKSELLPADAEDISNYCKARDVALRGKQAYPQFERFRPGYERWYLEDETDQAYMAEAIEAAIAVSLRLTDEMKTSEQLGFLEGEPFDRTIPLLVREGDGYRWEAHSLPPRAAEVLPSITVDDDLSLSRIKKARRGGEWGVKLFRHPQAMTDQEEYGMLAIDQLTAPPFFPWALAIVQVDTGYIIAVDFCDDPEDYAPKFAQSITDAVSSAGLPRKITVTDVRTEAVLRDFCGQFGVKLERKKRCEPLDKALDGLIEHMLGMEGDSEEGMIADIVDMLRDPEVVHNLPDEVLVMLLNETEFDDFPVEVANALVDEALRRGTIEKR